MFHQQVSSQVLDFAMPKEVAMLETVLSPTEQLKVHQLFKTANRDLLIKIYEIFTQR